MNKSDTFTLNFCWHRAAVGSEIRKSVTPRVTTKFGERLRPFVSVARASSFIRSFSSLRWGACEAIYRTLALAPVKINWYVSRRTESFLENAPDASRGFSGASTGIVSPWLLLLSDRHVECRMHNNLLSHLRIHRPHPLALFLASFRFSLLHSRRGASPAPTGEEHFRPCVGTQ